MSIARGIVRRRGRALTATVRRAPAPALLFVSVLGWAMMVWLTAGDAAHAGVAPAGPVIDVGHDSHATGAATGVAATALAPHALTMWAAMVAAMSPLLLLREVSRLWHGSLRRTRGLTLFLFAGGYTLVWVVAGMIAVPVADALAGSEWVGWFAVAIVLMGQCSPLRQRCLNVCHRVPRLRAFGMAAQVDAGRYGIVTGAACAASCGPIMVLVLLATDFHLVAMGAATVLLTTERYRPARRPRWRLPFAPARPEHVVLDSPINRKGEAHGDRDDAGSTVDAKAR